MALPTPTVATGTLTCGLNTTPITSLAAAMVSRTPVHAKYCHTEHELYLCCFEKHHVNTSEYHFKLTIKLTLKNTNTHYIYNRWPSWASRVDKGFFTLLGDTLDAWSGNGHFLRYTSVTPCKKKKLKSSKEFNFRQAVFRKGCSSRVIWFILVTKLI